MYFFLQFVFKMLDHQFKSFSEQQNYFVVHSDKTTHSSFRVV